MPPRHSSPPGGGPALKRDKDYYFVDGDVIFKVCNPLLHSVVLDLTISFPGGKHSVSRPQILLSAGVNLL